MNSVAMFSEIGVNHNKANISFLLMCFIKRKFCDYVLSSFQTNWINSNLKTKKCFWWPLCSSSLVFSFHANISAWRFTFGLEDKVVSEIWPLQCTVSNPWGIQWTMTNRIQKLDSCFFLCNFTTQIKKYNNICRKCILYINARHIFSVRSSCGEKKPGPPPELNV